jgi:hypothetical protein
VKVSTFVVAAAFGLAIRTASGQTSAGEEGVAITVYSVSAPGAIPSEVYQPALQPPGYYAQPLPGYAIVKQQRRVSLTEGRSTLRFADVAARIEPTTVLFKSLTDPEGTAVLEQNFEFDLVGPEKLLEKFIEQPVTLQFVRESGSVDQLRGTLLSNAGGAIILNTGDAANPIQIIRHTPERIGLSEVPGGLITRPTLVWNLHAKRAGEHLVRVSYETRGVTWWADYNLVFREGANANSGALDLSAWVSIINRAGATFPDAKLKLVAGDVQRIRPQSLAGFGGGARNEAARDMSLSGFQERSFFEYHLYTLGRPTTLSDNSTKQVELFPPARNVPCEKVLVYYGLSVPWWNWSDPIQDRELGVAMNTKVDVYLRLVNDEASGLGIPLPSGRIRVNKLDPADETLEFIGEDTIDHTPRNEKVLVKLGAAFDVVGERRQTDFSIDVARRQMDEGLEIKVRNRKQEPVQVIVKENLYRWSNWKILARSHDFEQQDARTVHFPITVPADGEVVVKYGVHYWW